MEDLTLGPDSSNDEIDEKVFKAIQGGGVKFRTICARLGIKAYQGNFRSIDRSLQRLRRVGKIAFDKKEQVWREVRVTVGC